MKILLFSYVFFFSFAQSFSQRLDTIRVHDFQAGINRFKVITKNNSEFSFIYRYKDTLKGSLSKSGDDYFMLADTTKQSKKTKNFYRLVSSSMRFIWSESAKVPLLHLSHDTTKFFHFDTSDVSSTILGTYITSNGYVGCKIEIKSEYLILFQPFNDVGFNERVDSAHWKQRGHKLAIEGKSSIDKWFTDHKALYLLPYTLVGKQSKKLKKKYQETYTYFAKMPTDE